MRYIMIIGAALLILASCATAPDSSSDPALSTAVAELLAATWSMLHGLASVMFDLHALLWETLGPQLQPVLGLIHCMNLLLIVAAVYTWRTAARIKRRFMGE